MKKVLLLSSALVAFSVAASALTMGPTNCTPFPVTFNGGVGSSSVSCPGFNVAGAVLTDVVVNYYTDYQFGAQTGTSTVQVTYTPGPGGFVLPVTTVTDTGGFSSGGIQLGSAIDTTVGVGGSTFAGFSVGITSTVTGGSVATSSGAVAVSYDYTIPTGVPEPAAMSLLGVGLVGIGFLARRFRK